MLLVVQRSSSPPMLESVAEYLEENNFRQPRFSIRCQRYSFDRVFSTIMIKRRSSAKSPLLLTTSIGDHSIPGVVNISQQSEKWLVKLQHQRKILYGSEQIHWQLNLRSRGYSETDTANDQNRRQGSTETKSYSTRTWANIWTKSIHTT